MTAEKNKNMFGHLDQKKFRKFLKCCELIYYNNHPESTKQPISYDTLKDIQDPFINTL